MASVGNGSYPVIEIYAGIIDREVRLSLLTENLSAGFPSPAMDFLDTPIDLQKHLIKRPSSTFIGRVNGYSMKDAGISHNDILVIDKSIKPKSGMIAVCLLDGEFVVKRLEFEQDGCWLVPENKDYKKILVTSTNDFMVWGIVTFVVKGF